MSTKVRNLAWDVDLPLTRKMVLIALADQANDHGEAYPGLKSLRRRCSMGMRTVYEALSELEADGYITREHTNGVRTLYTIQLQRMQQGDLLKGVGVRHAQGCATRTGAAGAGVREAQDCGTRKEGGAAGAHIKATKSKATGVGTRAEQLEVMGSYDRSLIQPFLHDLPESVQVQVFADFVKHCQVKRGPLSISTWLQLRDHLRSLAAQGVDLNASLRETMLAQLVIPIVPGKKPHKGGAPPGNVTADFSAANYETADHDAPSFLDEPDATGSGGDAE